MGDLRITVALGLFLFFFLSFFEEEEEEEEPKPRAFSVEDLGEEGLLPSLSLSSSASCFSADASDLTATAEVILLFVVVVVELLEMEIGEIENRVLGFLFFLGRRCRRNGLQAPSFLINLCYLLLGFVVCMAAESNPGEWMRMWSC